MVTACTESIAASGLVTGLPVTWVAFGSHLHGNDLFFNYQHTCTVYVRRVQELPVAWSITELPTVARHPPAPTGGWWVVVQDGSLNWRPYGFHPQGSLLLSPFHLMVLISKLLLKMAYLQSNSVS